MTHSEILIPAPLAKSIKEVLDAASKQVPENDGMAVIVGHARACSIFLGECIKAQRDDLSRAVSQRQEMRERA